ncbi:hypothetical protein LTR85_002313 [Meristemomyces frigidus]|nr:hypothetical protein LTR85_002313 [Meristemomyces frigidus]
MNENIVERFGRSRNGVRTETNKVEVWLQPPTLNTNIRQYFDDAKKHVDGGSWLGRPEVPTLEEVLDTDVGSSTSSDIVEIVPNKPTGAWESKGESAVKARVSRLQSADHNPPEAYLGAQYELLREDAVRPLREAMSNVRAYPTASEEAFNGTIGIYDKVHICAITCSTRGIAIRVTFSLQRAGKKVLWEQSKRLISGSLVVLSPADDAFKTQAIVATVAARPLQGLQQNPPEIDLFIARPEEMELDPAMEFVMVEERTGFYEADRHTLLALQKMMREPFPLSEHLVQAQTKVSPPTYVQQQPKADLTSVLRNNKHETYENVDILKHWPKQPSSDLDGSQLAALHRILTKRLAIIQGPPGTGKTHVSVEAIKIMLANRKSDDPPIIVACQTNHAVDQLLRHIAQFEPDFIRLGGRSKDRDVIKKRTLYEVKQQTSEQPLAGCMKQNARKKMKLLEKEFALLLSPLKPEKTPLDFRMLEKLGLLSQKQAQSLEDGASEWVQDKQANPNEARASPFNVWLGKALVTVPLKQLPEEFGFDYEEADLAFEQLKELEAENQAKDDEDFESLTGLTVALADNFTCRKVTGMTEGKVKEALKQQDMWKVPEAVRGAVYRHLQTEAKKHILTGFREKAKIFNEQAAHRRTGMWEEHETILKTQKVIGMTTTGFSKYRGLIAALQPKIILIEEAAETLEAPVTVACVPSLQHLILVGDHKQLRPHCHVKAHEDKPYFFNVSLFERMVNNKVEYDTLSKQRRMIPEIRRILYPIYGDLINDHASVLDPERRPNVPGMGGVNSFFFTHQWSEQRDDHMSSFNPEESDMIVGFVEYLHYNGMNTEDITVLTFYNGQRKRILSDLRKCVSMTGRKFNVVTVDSYQGEENKVVLLSLVRSNDKNQIGFLNIDNRVCVALSRAQCGFYIFGNGMLLYPHKTWKKVIDIMAAKKRKHECPKVEPIIRLAEALPLRCSNHNEEVLIREPTDWQQTFGGCHQKCKGRLPCGHACELNCHPFDHDIINCHQPCGRTLPCGHGNCTNVCGEICSCKTCNKSKAVTQVTNTQAPQPFDGHEKLSQASSSSEEWKSFAQEEPMRYAVAVASAPPSQRPSPQKSATTAKLLDLDEPEEVTKGVRQLSFGLDGNASQSGSSRPGSTSEETVIGDGTRKKWTETFSPSGKVTTEKEEAVAAEEKKHFKDWSKEESLIDL